MKVEEQGHIIETCDHEGVYKDWLKLITPIAGTQNKFVVPSKVNGVNILGVTPGSLSEINAKTVTFEENTRIVTLGMHSMQNSKHIENLELPKILLLIGEKAMAHGEYINILINSAKLKNIGDQAFKKLKCSGKFSIIHECKKEHSFSMEEKVFEDAFINILDIYSNGLVDFGHSTFCGAHIEKAKVKANAIFLSTDAIKANAFIGEMDLSEVDTVNLYDEESDICIDCKINKMQCHHDKMFVDTIEIDYSPATWQHKFMISKKSEQRIANIFNTLKPKKIIIKNMESNKNNDKEIKTLLQYCDKMEFKYDEDIKIKERYFTDSKNPKAIFAVSSTETQPQLIYLHSGGNSKDIIIHDVDKILISKDAFSGIPHSTNVKFDSTPTFIDDR